MPSPVSSRWSTNCGRATSRPSVTITRNSGILLPSNDYEQLKTQNILVPKAGIRYDLSDRWSLMAGLSLRPTPSPGIFRKRQLRRYRLRPLRAGHRGARPYRGPGGRPRRLRTVPRLKSRRVVKSPGQGKRGVRRQDRRPGYPLGGKVLTGKISATITF